TPLGGLNRSQQSILRTHDNHTQVRTKFADTRHHIKPVFIGHHDIRDHQIAIPIGDPVPQGSSVTGTTHLVALTRQSLRQYGTDRAIIISNKNSGRARAHTVSSLFFIILPALTSSASV